MPDLLPENPRVLFTIQAPLGYKVDKVCNTGHPVAFKHEFTGGTYTVFTIGNQMACPICIAQVVGMTCVRPHMAFEVRDAED